MPDGLEVDVGVQLAASITTLSDELRTERQRKIQLAQDVAYIQAPVIAGPAVPLVPPTWGPKTGYAWGVQRITLSGLGATTDFVTAYRGKSPNDLVPQNALFTFTITTAGAVATWHPGRTGCVLVGNEGLVFGGTFTGAQLVAAVDVIQLQLDKLPYYLL